MAKKLEDHNYNGIDATIIADSKNEFGNRITTFIVTFPRIVLAEFNTHRMLSRNSASSRAVPPRKMIRKLKETPFVPIKWMKDHTGMQGKEYFDSDEKFNLQELKDIMFETLMKAFNSEDADDLELIDLFTEMMEEMDLFGTYTLNEFWLILRDKVINCAILLICLGVTKQIVNRLLEPFMWHTAIVTATEWENFFALRAHPAAEIHIAKLAEIMLEQYNESAPKELKAGEWHIPFGDNMDIERLVKLSHDLGEEKGLPVDVNFLTNKKRDDLMVKIATARCARVSYLNFEGKDDYEADIKLYDRLAKMGHWSPFEHCARAMTLEDQSILKLEKHNMSEEEIALFRQEWNKALEKPLRPIIIENIDNKIEFVNFDNKVSNFKGFVQHRKDFQNENKTDDRVIK